MKEYQRINERRRRLATVAGVVLTLLAHTCALIFVSFSGIKYIWPPPKEQTFLIDFEEEKPVKIKEKRGVEPRSRVVDKKKPVELVQKSESPVAAKRKNLTPATKPDDHGDVPVPTPEQEPKIDPRASFPGMAKKDTSLTAAHSALDERAAFKAGQVEGNTAKGPVDGKPSARLEGRNTIGGIPKPVYDIQEEGTVVVKIWVDNYGKVTKALAGVEGTTVTDNKLWAAARKSAMNTHFTQKADAPALQEGSITYIFKLK